MNRAGLGIRVQVGSLLRRTKPLAAGLLSLFMSLPSSASPTNPRLKGYIEKHKTRLLQEYSDLLAIPNLASDSINIRRNAEAIVAILQKRGVGTRLLEMAGSPPLVLGEIRQPGAARTVIFYAHYDGQPVDPSQWTDDPWKPVLRDGRLEDGGKVVDRSKIKVGGEPDYRIYARSSSDDKAPIMALSAALDFLQAEKIPLSVNVKFLFEGEEEAGSPHLPALIRKHKDLLQADALFVCDGPVDQSGRKQLVFGARGSIGLELTVYGPDHPLHSGHYGNWAPNPVVLLANLISTMRDGDGNILIDRFYEDVRPISEKEKQAIRDIPDIDDRLRREYGLAWTEADGARLAERILRPALNLRGIRGGAIGGQAANAIPPEASASIDFRLVPDQNPGSIKRLVEAHLQQNGFHILRRDPDREERLKYPKLIKVEWDEGYPPYKLPLDDPFGLAVARTLAEALTDPPLKLPSLGGSVPMKMFADVLGIPVLGLPIVNYDNNQHGPNENLRLENLWDGIAMFAGLLAGLGKSFI
jgi:acetylornithine deacetylase/succinyl-diaminopimelate desuccinylase-like protein